MDDLKAVLNAGSGFCLGASAFCVVYCLFLAWMISIDYEYVLHMSCSSITACVVVYMRACSLRMSFAASWESGRPVG
jgi:hypothetical protein